MLRQDNEIFSVVRAMGDCKEKIKIHINDSTQQTQRMAEFLCHRYDIERLKGKKNGTVTEENCVIQSVRI